MFRLSETPIDATSLKTQTQDPKSGGFVCFEGWVRNHNLGKTVTALDYTAHPKLAQAVGQDIVQDALTAYDINAAHCVHRIGTLGIGDMAIWVGVSADHRKAAFDACEYILERVKKEVPIWKNEHYSDGKSGWVENQTPSS